MLGADRALHGAHHPALDQGEDQVHSRENLVRVQAGGGNRGALVCVALAGRRRVGRPAVGDDPAARLEVRVQERGQADRAGVGDDTQAGTADPALVATAAANSTFPRAPRPGTPGSGPPRKLSSTSTSPRNRSRPGPAIFDKTRTPLTVW